MLMFASSQPSTPTLRGATAHGKEDQGSRSRQKGNPDLFLLRQAQEPGAQSARRTRRQHMQRVHRGSCGPDRQRRLGGCTDPDGQGAIHRRSGPSCGAQKRHAFPLASAVGSHDGWRHEAARHGTPLSPCHCWGSVHSTLRYDSTATGPTVAGRGNPDTQGALGPRRGLSRPLRAHRLCAPSMAAPGGASFGWAGSLCPVFHPRLCAAARPHGGLPWFDS